MIGELKTYRSMLYQEVERRRNTPGGLGASEVDGQMRFDAGERIQAVRQELGIKPSRFVEMLKYPSQREFEAIEQRTAESPLYLLHQVHTLTGATMEWLKHGDEPRYDVDYMRIHPVQDSIDFFEGFHSNNFHLTLDTKNLHVGIVIKISDWRYQTLDLGMSLDF